MEQERFVFISYASKEMETASKVCKFLEDNGIRCWIAPRNVNAGSNYATQIVSAIKSAVFWFFWRQKIRIAQDMSVMK